MSALTHKSLPYLYHGLSTHQSCVKPAGIWQVKYLSFCTYNHGQWWYCCTYSSVIFLLEAWQNYGRLFTCFRAEWEITQVVEAYFWILEDFSILVKKPQLLTVLRYGAALFILHNVFSTSWTTWSHVLCVHAQMQETSTFTKRSLR